MSNPEIVVGLDVGMTCTGVAYLNRAAGSKTIRWIQRWPGKTDTNENKVPTVVVYEKENNHLPPTSWGFKSESETERAAANRVYREWFKTQLGPLSVNSGEHDVERWYEDYLRKLYEHIERTIGRELIFTSWKDATIEYVFSVPTSWSGPTVENFKRIARRAGFEDGTRPRHSIIMGLTEPEAVAVHTSVEASGRLRKGDTICVCDAGGGTTDLSILKITDAQNGSLAMQQLLTVSGEDVGSTYIDAEFECFIQKRLASIESELSQTLEEISWEIMKSRDFQDNKCTFGDHDDNIEIFPVKIPDLANSYSNPAVGIKFGRMEVKMIDLKRIFDEQVHKIQAMIDQELQRLERQYHPNEQVNHLILSGGLSNSAYVQDQIRKRYAFNASGFSNAKSINVWVAPDPQLAVCKGLVEDRSRKLTTGKHVIETRCCRASYGTVCREKYNAKNHHHRGRKTIKDPADGNEYITDAIEWFIRKGEPISGEQLIERPFKMRIRPGSEASRRVYKTSIVVSYGDPEFLPDYMDNTTKKLVDLQSDLSSVSESKFKEKNKHLWRRMGGKQHYYECSFEIRVIVGPADIMFELWFSGLKLSIDEAIQVEWQAAEAPTKKKELLQPAMAEMDASPPDLPELVADFLAPPSHFLPNFLQFGANRRSTFGLTSSGQTGCA